MMQVTPVMQVTPCYGNVNNQLLPKSILEHFDKKKFLYLLHLTFNTVLCPSWLTK